MVEHTNKVSYNLHEKSEVKSSVVIFIPFSSVWDIYSFLQVCKRSWFDNFITDRENPCTTQMMMMHIGVEIKDSNFGTPTGTCCRKQLLVGAVEN